MKRRSAQGKSTASSSTSINASPGARIEICYIDKLSDAVLTTIFKCLDLDDLVKLRQVCRKWNLLLTTCEEFWQNGHLSYNTERGNYSCMSSAKSLFWAGWRMAPVLDTASFEIDWRERADFSQKLLKKCPLKIKSLHFIYDNMPPEAMFTLLKKYQNTVEQLLINDTYTPYVEKDVKRIWIAIQDLPKLKHLIIDGAALLYFKASLSKAKPCWQTLKMLDVKDSSYEDMNTVQRIISMHSNWTEVYLSSNVSLARAELKALSKCTDLQSVQAPFCKEIKLLLNCEKLDTLVLDCSDEKDELKQVVSALEKKKTCFPNLSGLKMIGGNSDYVPFLKSLLKGSPKVRLLNFVDEEMEACEMLEVLSCTSALEKLYLHEVGSDFLVPILDELAQGKVPTLKKVLLYECDCEEECIKECVYKFNMKGLPVKIVTDCSCNP